MGWLPSADSDHDQGRLYEGNNSAPLKDPCITKNELYKYSLGLPEDLAGTYVELIIVPREFYGTLEIDDIDDPAKLRAGNLARGERVRVPRDGEVVVPFIFNPPGDFNVGEEVRLGVISLSNDAVPEPVTKSKGGRGGLFCETA